MLLLANIMLALLNYSRFFFAVDNSIKAYCRIVVGLRGKAMNVTYQLFYVLGWGISGGLTVWVR